MKKNYNLFKSILVCFLVFVVLSWIIPTGTLTDGALETSTIKPVGLYGLFYYPTVTITTFIQFGLIALAIGGFYGVLNKTGVYVKLVENVAKKQKGKEQLFLILTIVGITLFSSIIGTQYAILAFVPLIIGILLKMGFNKMTALAATVGSTLAGAIASTYGYNIGTQISQILSTNINDHIIFKIAFLVIVLFLYMLFVTGNEEAKLKQITKKITKKKETKEEKTKSTTKKVSTTKKKKEEVGTIEVTEKIIIPFAEEEIVSKKSTKPLVIMLIFLGLLLFIGMTNWKYMFGFEGFEKFHEAIAGIKIGELSIISSIINISNPIGYWSSAELVIALLIFSGVIGWIYNLSIDEMIEGFVTGSKRMFKTSFLMCMASLIFALMLVGSGTTMFATIAGKLNSITSGFNFFFTSLTALISGFFYNDFYYALNAISSIYTNNFGDSFLVATGFIFQTMHSIMMMIMPTSIILIAGLSMLNISFKEWIKYIYKFALQMVAISLVISVILVLIA